MGKSRQTKLFKTEKSDYGGKHRNTRKGRAHGRPLAVRHTMHLILKSTKAKDDWSFRRAKNDKNIRRILEKFAFIYGIQIISIANAWNHLHLQIKLSNRFTYPTFIRSITGAIAMSVTGRTRWNKNELAENKSEASVTTSRTSKFWDHRPFTRIASSWKEFLNLRDYVRMNQIEDDGFCRTDARSMVQVEKIFERME